MRVEKRTIESNLPRKGFVLDDSGDHRYFYHEYLGQRTGAYTYTSHGTTPRTIDENLLNMMKKQLRLGTSQQVIKLFKCPMSGDDYNDILGIR